MSIINPNSLSSLASGEIPSASSSLSLEQQISESAESVDSKALTDILVTQWSLQIFTGSHDKESDPCYRPEW